MPGTDASRTNGALLPPPKASGLLFGLGLGGFIDGIVLHQILQVHHVRDDLGGPLAWDIGFLVFGVLLIVGGWLLHRRGLAALTAGLTNPRSART